MRVARTVLALAVFLSPSVAAQQAPKARFYVAGGVDGADLINTFGRSGVGPSFQIGYFRQFTRLGYRLGIAYHERHRDYTGSSFYPHATSRTSTVAATFDLTYDLTRTGARPYLIAGAGVYRSSDWAHSLEGDRTHYGRVGVAPVLGAGLRFRLGTAEAFTELRLHLGKSYSATRVWCPLTFGIRF
jgi:hypothetical protein